MTGKVNVVNLAFTSSGSSHKINLAKKKQARILFFSKRNLIYVKVHGSLVPSSDFVLIDYRLETWGNNAFVDAAKVEIEALDKKGTYQEVDRPTDRSVQVLPLTWVFTNKVDSNGMVVKHKARICVRGDLQKVPADVNYSDTLAIRTARAMFAFAAAFDLDTGIEGDISQDMKHNKRMTAILDAICPEFLRLGAQASSFCGRTCTSVRALLSPPSVQGTIRTWRL